MEANPKSFFKRMWCFLMRETLFDLHLQGNSHLPVQWDVVRLLRLSQQSTTPQVHRYSAFFRPRCLLPRHSWVIMCQNILLHHSLPLYTHVEELQQAMTAHDTWKYRYWWKREYKWVFHFWVTIAHPHSDKIISSPPLSPLAMTLNISIYMSGWHFFWTSHSSLPITYISVSETPLDFLKFCFIVFSTICFGQIDTKHILFYNNIVSK